MIRVPANSNDKSKPGSRRNRKFAETYNVQRDELAIKHFPQRKTRDYMVTLVKSTKH
jgi:hypothetical protein